MSPQDWQLLMVLVEYGMVEYGMVEYGMGSIAECGYALEASNVTAPNVLRLVVDLVMHLCIL